MSCFSICTAASFRSMFVSQVQFWAPTAAGGGVSLVMAFLNGTDVPDLLRLQTLITKFVGSISSCAANLTVGTEGPLVHMGACIASVIAFWECGKHLHCLELSLAEADMASAQMHACYCACCLLCLLMCHSCIICIVSASRAIVCTNQQNRRTWSCLYTSFCNSDATAGTSQACTTACAVWLLSWHASCDNAWVLGHRQLQASWAVPDLWGVDEQLVLLLSRQEGAAALQQRCDGG